MLLAILPLNESQYKCVVSGRVKCLFQGETQIPTDKSCKYKVHCNILCQWSLVSDEMLKVVIKISLNFDINSMCGDDNSKWMLAWYLRSHE